MIHTLTPYPAMKDSGVPWLGQVPEHWDIKRLGSVLKERGEVNQKGEVTEVLSVMKDIGVIPYAEKGNVGNKKSDDIERYKIVRPDDLVMNSMNVIIGSVGISRYTGCLSQVYYVLERRDKKDDPRYIELVFRNKMVQHSLTRIGNGILAHRMRIPMELLKSEPFLLPPPNEQAAIVRYLDHADRRIRRTIAAKQKLIKLLQEQKQVIIHQAVTRGLDPDVKLKPSGVEWLGDVPEGWETVPAKRLFQEIDRRSATGEEVLLSLRMYQGLVPHNIVSNIPIAASALIGYKHVEPGQIIMNRMRAAIGMFGLATCSGLVSPDYAVFRVADQVEPDYFLKLFKTKAVGTIFRMESKGLGTGSSGFMRLYTDRFGRINLPLPPVEEQRAIVAATDKLTENFDFAITRAQQEISFLREYRTRLIADVVTGKLDVRDAAALLPEPEGEALPDELEADVDELEADEAADVEVEA